VLARFLPLAVLLHLVLAATAGAVIIDSDDGTGNTSAPADDPGWIHMGIRGGLTGTYIGEGWILSAAHVGEGYVIIDGTVYPAISGSRVVLTHSGSTQADVELFRIDPYPPLPTLPIRSSAPSLGTSVIMIGNGYDRGAAFSFFPPSSQDDGYDWDTTTQSLRWGTNAVEEVNLDLELSSSVTRILSTEFTRNAPDHEAQAAVGDSGGAVFIKNGGTWELAGVMFAIAGFQDQPTSTAVYDNLTYAADLSYYRDQILDILTPLCGNGHLTIDEDCDDGNTDDGDCCSASCEFEPVGSACDDGNACAESDGCDGGGICQAGAPVDCDDGNPCTADSCDEIAGCTHDPIPGCGGPAVPSMTAWGRLLLVALLVAATAILVRTSHRVA